MISIIVPCYNCEDTLNRCVESLLKNDADEMEIVLVDDGSVDKTSSLCDYYADKYSYIKTVHKKNGGLVSAWKKGVEESDDIIEMVMPYIKQFAPDILLYGIKMEYSDDSIVLKQNNIEEGFYAIEELNSIKEQLLFTGAMQSKKIFSSRCSKVFKREILENCMGLISDSLTYGEDTVTTYTVFMNVSTMYVIGNYYRCSIICKKRNSEK